jgi:predicted PurR-regulated permease PerM
MRDSSTFSKGTRFVINAACMVLIIGGVKAASAIVVPFLLALFIAIIAAPFMYTMQRYGVRKPLAVAIIVLVLVGCGVGLGVLVGRSFNDFTTKLSQEEYQKALRSKMLELARPLERFDVEVTEEKLNEFLESNANSNIMTISNKIVSGISGILSNAFLIVLAVIFLLLEASDFPLKFRAAFESADQSLSSLSDFTEDLNRYLMIKTAVSFVTGVVIWIILSLIGVEYAILWAILAFALNFIPNIGSFLASFPAIFLAFVQLTPMHAVLTAMGYFVTNFTLGGLIEPRLTGERLGLSTLVVFMSLVFWGWVLGPVGMLLSVPLTMIIRILLQHNEETRWIAIMLGSRTNFDNIDASIPLGRSTEASRGSN